MGMTPEQAVESFKRYLYDCLDGAYDECDIITSWDDSWVGRGQEYELDEAAMDAVTDYITGLMRQLSGSVRESKKKS